MRSPEQPECYDHHHGTNPGNVPGQLVISESEKRSEQIENRQEHASDRHDHDEYGLAAITPAQHPHVAFAALLKHATNKHVDNETDQKDDIPGLDLHEREHKYLLHCRQPGGP